MPLAQRPQVDPDPTWNVDPADLHAISDRQIEQMTDAQQRAYSIALDQRQQALSRLRKELRFKLSPQARSQSRRALEETTELYKRLGAVSYDQERRSGRYDKQLGRHPHAWSR